MSGRGVSPHVLTHNVPEYEIHTGRSGYTHTTASRGTLRMNAIPSAPNDRRGCHISRIGAGLGRAALQRVIFKQKTHLQGFLHSAPCAWQLCSICTWTWSGLCACARVIASSLGSPHRGTQRFRLLRLSYSWSHMVPIRQGIWGSDRLRVASVSLTRHHRQRNSACLYIGRASGGWDAVNIAPVAHRSWLVARSFLLRACAVASSNSRQTRAPVTSPAGDNAQSGRHEHSCIARAACATFYVVGYMRRGHALGRVVTL